MSLHKNIGGTIKTISKLTQNVGGTLKTITSFKQNVGGVFKEVFSQESNAFPTSLTWSANGSNSTIISTTNNGFTVKVGCYNKNGYATSNTFYLAAGTKVIASYSSYDSWSGNEANCSSCTNVNIQYGVNLVNVDTGTSTTLAANGAFGSGGTGGPKTVSTAGNYYVRVSVNKSSYTSSDGKTFTWNHDHGWAGTFSFSQVTS